MDLRENGGFADEEERARVQHTSLMTEYWFAMPVQIPSDTKDGHVTELVPTIQRRVLDPTTGDVSFEDFPIHPDAPIHYAGGGGVTATHPVKQGDEGIALYLSRGMDYWHQNGDTQQPTDTRTHSIRDATLIPGIRSTPRKLQQVSNDAHHVRSDDKKHVSEVHPQNGHRTFSADPSTAPASPSFDPLSMATKFLDHVVQGASGLLGRAVDGGTEHSHGITHDAGAFMTALNALHTVLCHPSNGASLNALNGLHQVLAHPSIGAALMGQNGASSVIAKATLALQSSAGISLSCPAGGLSLPAGSVGGSSLGSGAAAQNVGTLSGDLAGTLPSPIVVNLSHVAGQNQALVQAAGDSAASAAGVMVGGLYINTAVKSGVGVLCVRMT